MFGFIQFWAVTLLCLFFGNDLTLSMAASSGVRKRRYNRFPVGKYMALQKEKWDNVLKETKAIQDTDVELAQKKKELCSKRERMRRIDAKIENLDKYIDEGGDVISEVNRAGQGSSEPPRKKRFISERSTSIRMRNPTQLGANSTVSLATSRRRRSETFEAACQIHGATSHSNLPGQVGLCDTAITKCSEKVLVNVFSKNAKTVKRVIPKILQKGINDYEKSNDNMTRSIAVYYSGGIMGKRKYRNVYRASSYKKSNKAKSLRIKVNNCPIPRLLPYNKLANYIKSIDIGKLYSIRETLCDGLDEIDKVDGVYRNIQEMVLILAKYYLVCQKRYELVWFNKQTYTFNISLGGDGAPFGKEDTSCCWLVSFLNLGRKVLSSNENYLLFGANCKEDCVPVRRFLQKCLSDISDLEKSTFHVECGGETVNVRFHVSEMPNDMKMLAFLGGELSNAATFFSTFANVSTHNMNSLAGSFSFSGKEMWKPWKYEDRVSVAKKVEQFKKTIAKNSMAPATLRSKVTSFIAKLKSRQEFQPTVGRLIDRAHVDPLHLKNNACVLTHRLLLYEVIAMSKLGKKVNSFSQVPSNSPFKMYILSMRDCNLSRLANKIIKWFDETGANGKSFEYRFTGKQSRLFLLHFMKLISHIEPISEPGREKTILHVLAYICLLLRDCVSMFSRINISNDEIKKLTSLCRDYFRANALFFQVNPTVWTIGNIVPAHTQYMKDKYGFGLGINSMEGREAKHVFIAKYSKNTNFFSRWEQIFRHEFVSLIWLRERGFNLSNERSDHSCAKSYIPKQVSSGDLAYCYCGLQKVCISDKKCRFCADKLRSLIVSSVTSGKNLVFK